MTEIADKLLKAIDKAIANVTRYDMEATEQNKATMDATQDGMICGLMTAKEIIMIVDQDFSNSKESGQTTEPAVKTDVTDKNKTDSLAHRGRKTPINRNTQGTVN